MNHAQKTSPPRALRFVLAALLIAGLTAACAPRARAPQAAPATPAPIESPTDDPRDSELSPEDSAQDAPEDTPGDTLTLTDPVALETDRAAREAFHLMELSYLETGIYSANVLLTDLELPGGVRWMLEDLSETFYMLRITSDALPSVAWFVSPEGVVARQIEDNRIY